MLLLLAACTGPDDVANKAPDAPIIALSPSSPTTTDDLLVTVQGGAADPEGDPVTFTYAWFTDGVDAGVSGESVSADLTTRGETWRVIVTPTDGDLEGTAAMAEVTIANTAPTATLSLDPLAPTTTDAVTATATPDDGDGDAVTFAWEWTRDGVSAGLTEPTLPAGVHRRGEVWTVTATPSDDTDAGAPVTAGFTVANAPPTLASVSLSPEGATTVDTLTALASGGDDADGDAIVVTMEWWIDGALVATEEVADGAASTLSGVAVRGDRVRVVATPSDGSDQGAPVESAELEITNAAPSAAEASILPNPLTVADAATCVGAGWADPDGDAEGWRVSWTVDGAEVSTDPTLPAGSATRGEVVGCTLTPWDGLDEGAPVAAAAVTVQNAAPTCATAAITIGPEPATIASVLSITTDGYTGCADADGDALTRTYAWTVDGVPAGSGSTLSAAFVRGQAVSLTTAWTDGYTSAATAVSNEVIVQNQAPVVASVVLSPRDPVTTDVLSAAVTSTDLEGDPVVLTWAWAVDGLAVSTAETLDGVWFARDQVVDVSVTPSDGFDVGAAVGVSVVIANSPPGAPGLALSPAQIEDDDAIVCSIATAATDADADPLDYSFTWEVDGAPYTGATGSASWAGDTVPADVTSLGQRWTCAVVASDGTDVGPAAEISAVVGCDRDLDGYADVACGGDDCDDADPTRHPGATEVCDAADLDEDCDGLADDADPSLVGTTYYRDADGDSYGVDTDTVVACARPAGYRSVAGDCNDTSASVNPGRTEVCDAADLDEDCDGLADDADSSVTGQVNQWPDADGDGYGDAASSIVRLCSGASGYANRSGDCDETDPEVNPGELEVCNDGIDNDCDPDGGECGINGSLTSADADFAISPDRTANNLGTMLAWGDFDADGHPDLATPNLSEDRVGLYRGPMAVGDTSEAIRESEADAWFTYSNAIGYVLVGPGDVNGDGYDDLVAEDYEGAGVFLLEGSASLPDVALAAGDAFLDTNIYSSVVPAGDFDDDGFADVLVGTLRGSTFACELWTGGAAGLTLAATFGPTGYWCAAAGAGGRDWDGDGLDDTVIIRGVSSAVSTYRVQLIAGDTSPTSAPLDDADAWVTALDYAWVSAAGDVDQDGHEDIAAQDGRSGELYVFLGPPTPGLTTADAWAHGPGLLTAPGDTDGDGADELFLQADAWVYRYALPLPSGSFPEPVGAVQYGNSSTAMAGPIAGVDFTADGLGDLVFGTYGTGDNAVRLYEGGNE